MATGTPTEVIETLAHLEVPTHLNEIEAEEFDGARDFVGRCVERRGVELASSGFDIDSVIIGVSASGSHGRGSPRPYGTPDDSQSSMSFSIWQQHAPRG